MLFHIPIKWNCCGIRPETGIATERRKQQGHEQIRRDIRLHKQAIVVILTNK